MTKTTGALCLLLSWVTLPGYAQTRTNAPKLILTNKDSLNQGAPNQKTVISGNGSVFYEVRVAKVMFD